MIKRYTANQPLFLGGQIYMWNRYLESKNLVHMIEAQFTKFGHQSRIELLTKDGNKIWAMLPLADRNFKPIGEIELHEPHINVDKLIKTIKTIYPEKKVAEPIFHQDLLELLWANRYKPLGWFNVDSTNLIYYYLFGATEYTTHVSTKIVPQRPKDPSEWVAELGSAINCTDYLGGGVANDAYLNLEDFTKLGMTVSIQDYSMPEYKVGNLKTTEGKEPLLNKNSYISILDPIFKVGKQETLQIIKGISKG